MYQVISNKTKIPKQNRLVCVLSFGVGVNNKTPQTQLNQGFAALFLCR